MATQVARSTISGPAVPARTGVTLLARVRDGGGNLIVRAGLSSIAWAVTDLTGGTSLGSGTFTVAASVFDSLQQGDPRWLEDDSANPGADGAWGFNFAGALPASLFALTTPAVPSPLSGGAQAKQVQADVTFTPTSGEPWRVSWRWRVLPAYG